MVDADEFVLIDSTAPDNEPDGGASSVRRAHRAWWSGPAAWVVVAVLLTVVGSSVARPVAVGQGTGVEIGLSHLNLAGTPEVAWETEYVMSEVLGTIEDRAILGVDATGIARDVVGLDLETGAEMWRYHDEGLTCLSGSPVVCAEHAGGPDAVLVIIDITDGSQQQLPQPGALAGIAAGDDLVVAIATGSTLEKVIRIGPDGEQRWQTMAEAVDTTNVPPWSFMSITDQGLHLMDGTFDLQTGEKLDLSQFLIADGIWFEPSGGDQGGGIMHTARGDVVVSPDESMPSVTDDIGGPVALATDGRDLIARMRGNGSELWRLAATTCYPTALVRGVVVLSCWDATVMETVGLDALTGEERWRLPHTDWTVAISSDTLVLAQLSTAEVVGVDIRTGEQRWAIPVGSTDNGWLFGTDLEDSMLVVATTSVMRIDFDR